VTPRDREQVRESGIDRSQNFRPRRDSRDDINPARRRRGNCEPVARHLLSACNQTLTDRTRASRISLGGGE